MKLISDGSTNLRFLDKVQLVKFRQRALRAGIWFSVLPRIDRVLVNLTIKVADVIRSSQLANSLLALAGKIDQFVEGKFVYAIREAGFPIAAKCAALAKQWGYQAAESWETDDSYARFWAIMTLNEHLPPRRCSCM